MQILRKQQLVFHLDACKEDLPGRLPLRSNTSKYPFKAFFGSQPIRGVCRGFGEAALSSAEALMAEAAQMVMRWCSSAPAVLASAAAAQPVLLPALLLLAPALLLLVPALVGAAKGAGGGRGGRGRNGRGRGKGMT